MNDILETLQVETTLGNNVCKTDPMIILMLFIFFTLFFYIIQFKIK
jgi:hypothetical protein